MERFLPLIALLAGLASWMLLFGVPAFAPPALASTAVVVAAEPANDSISSFDEPLAVVLRVIDPGPDAPYQVGRFLMADEEPVETDAEAMVLLTRAGEVIRLEPGEVATLRPQDEETADPLFRLLRALLRDGPSSAVDPAAHVADPTDPFLRPNSDELRPIRPTGDRMVRSLMPRMEWEGREEVATYRLYLWAADGTLVTMDAGSHASWTLPPEAALSPGARYEWAVEPLPGDRIGPRATFIVAPREILDEVAQELGGLRRRGLDPEGDGRLAAAAVFRSMGFAYDALDTLTDLQAAGDPLGPEVTEFHRRLVDELASSETQGSPDN